MEKQKRLLTELYQGLQALVDAAFPKTCSDCGTTYGDLKEFLQGTYSTISTSGLKQAEQSCNQPVVELYRTCRCGAQMLEFFRDRRDDTESGVLVRARFAQLLDLLQQTGLSLQTVRAELTLLLRGERSEIFHLLGLDIDIRH